MKLYVKDNEMPTDCSDCDFSDKTDLYGKYGYCFCYITKERNLTNSDGKWEYIPKLPTTCPLSPLSEVNNENNN